MIGTNLFMAVCMWIFLPIVYVSMRNSTVCKKNLILSVTLPPEARDDPEVAAYCEAFRKRLRQCCTVLTAVLVPAIFLPQVSVSITWSMTWLIFAMYFIMRTYGKGYKGLREIKSRRGWVIPTAPQEAPEPSPVKLPKPIKTSRFVMPMILSVLPVISCFVDQWSSAWSRILALTAGCNLLITATSLVCYGLVFRQKPEVADGNPALTDVLTKLRWHNWTKMWLLTSWLTALYALAVWLCQGNMAAYTVCTVIYAAAITTAAIVTEFSTRRAQQRLTGNSRSMPVVDEDDYWIWGQFYYNPSNKRAMINERVGMGMSMNFAHPAGKVMAVFTVLVLLAMPVMGVWLMTEELTAPTYTLTESRLTVRQASTTYTIDLDSIEAVELLEDLPSASRTWGTGLPNLLKGSFYVEGYGNCTLCLDPNDPPFLLIDTEHKTYLLGVDAAKEIYHALQ